MNEKIDRSSRAGEPGEVADADRDSMSEVIALYRRDVDASLLRSRLRLSVDERFNELMRMQAMAEEMRRAGRVSRGEAR